MKQRKSSSSRKKQAQKSHPTTDVAGNPPLHLHHPSSFSALFCDGGGLGRPRKDSDKKHHDGDHSNNNKNNNSKKDRHVMELAVGLFILSAAVLAVRNPWIQSTTPTTSTTQHKQQQLESSLRIRERQWGKDFDGYATITNKYKILQRFPHDPKDYTQGLQWHNQRLIESTGMYGQSQVKIWNPFATTTNNNNHNNNFHVDHVTNLDAKYFGEGLCWFQDALGRDRYIQLTWQEQTAFVYDTNLQLVHQFQYTTETTEGWGITFDPFEQVFYVSDGSDTIAVWDLNFERQRSFRVTLALRGQANHNQEDSYLRLINELEWDSNDQTLLANVWFQDAIVRIHPITGQVLQVWDFSKLYTNRDETAEVMNGIARYQGNQWWITGKYWPFLYLVELDSVQTTAKQYN